MTEPRRSTVYDFSDLRLHPDGSRVYQKDSNRQLWLANKVVQTANNTWIATDAGGSMKVSSFRSRVKNNTKQGDDEAEEFNLDDVSGGEEDQDEGQEKGTSADEETQSGQKRGLKKKVDGRTVKRRKFLEDFSYLGSPDVNTPSSQAAAPMELHPPIPHHEPFPFEPSADLLKFIHRFAAEFYTERGELLNVSKEYRKERKARRLKRLANAKKQGEVKESQKRGKGKEKAADSASEDEDEDSDLEHEQNEHEGRSESESDGEDPQHGNNTNSESEYLSGDASTKGEGTSTKVQKGNMGTQKRLRWKGKKRAEMLYKDMYKIFDGSALLALGMLVQEHIASLLMSQPPEGWEDQVKRTFGQPEADDDSNDVGQGHSGDGPLSTYHDVVADNHPKDTAENDVESNIDIESQEAQHYSGSKDPSGQNKFPIPQHESDVEDSSSSTSTSAGISANESNEDES
ncbi:hypothetical protein CVT24_001724 [Panaeolus cyanescens]|uniref:Uncharacterized protein n=1 Tax=Panaeolus cyanescens TaxID=181874 RepID=A0A409YUA7_9AGAR|nr:hypothetical protein CVT24_001724 [Panaeolus cyanescens]